MRTTEKSLLWVVYRMTIHGKPSGMSAVCEQGEWEAMERERPGYHTLVLGGITNEGEAERLARNSSGEANKAAEAKRPRTKRVVKPLAGDGAALVPSGAAASVSSLLP